MQHPPVELQTRWWNDWLTTVRETKVGHVSEDQARLVLRWVAEIQADRGRPLDIIDVGCGGGWLCDRLAPFGNVTGTDLADEVLARAQERNPDVTYVAGDFADLDLGEGCYDVVVTLEVLSHVADQPAFMAKCARLLRPNGLLLIANQNRWVLERNAGIMPQGEGQLRKWTTRGELRALMRPHFRVRDLTTLTPKGALGVLRWVNAPKVERALSLVLGGRANVTRLKERLGFGWTVIARGVKR